MFYDMIGGKRTSTLVTFTVVSLTPGLLPGTQQVLNGSYRVDESLNIQGKAIAILLSAFIMSDMFSTS